MSTKEQLLQNADKLSIREIRDAMRRNGYHDDCSQLRSVEFSSITSDGLYCYKTVFMVGDIDSEYIFIEVREDRNNTFQYFADY